MAVQWWLRLGDVCVDGEEKSILEKSSARGKKNFSLNFYQIFHRQGIECDADKIKKNIIKSLFDRIFKKSPTKMIRKNQNYSKNYCNVDKVSFILHFALL